MKDFEAELSDFAYEQPLQIPQGTPVDYALLSEMIEAGARWAITESSLIKELEAALEIGINNYRPDNKEVDYMQAHLDFEKMEDALAALRKARGDK